jgi:hypothetical protein
MSRIFVGEGWDAQAGKCIYSQGIRQIYRTVPSADRKDIERLKNSTVPGVYN